MIFVDTGLAEEEYDMHEIQPQSGQTYRKISLTQREATIIHTDTTVGPKLLNITTIRRG